MERHEESLAGKGGLNISYQTWTPTAPARGILVISHGLGEHGRRYDHVAERLGGLGLIVVVPDHRGHGRSGGPRAGLRRFADYTDDLDARFGLEQVGGAPRFLLGHSMGGTIALDYALDHQQSLAGLVLSGAAIVPGDD